MACPGCPPPPLPARTPLQLARRLGSHRPPARPLTPVVAGRACAPPRGPQRPDPPSAAQRPHCAAPLPGARPSSAAASGLRRRRLPPRCCPAIFAARWFLPCPQPSVRQAPPARPCQPPSSSSVNPCLPNTAMAMPLAGDLVPMAGQHAVVAYPFGYSRPQPCLRPGSGLATVAVPSPGHHWCSNSRVLNLPVPLAAAGAPLPAP